PDTPRRVVRRQPASAGTESERGRPAGEVAKFASRAARSRAEPARPLPAQPECLAVTSWRAGARVPRGNGGARNQGQAPGVFSGTLRGGLPLSTVHAAIDED